MGVVLLVAGLAAAEWLVGKSTDTQTQTFDASVNEVSVNVTGAVTITTGDTIEVTVDREWILFGAPDVDIAVEDGVLLVDMNCGSFRLWCQSSATVAVPAGTSVTVDTSAGDIEVAGNSGSVDLTTSAGDIQVEDVHGSARFATSAGTITGTVTDGDVDAATSAGSIDLDLFGEFASISAETSAGSVTLTVPNEVYDVDADTTAGDVITDVRTHPDADRQIVAESSAGSVTVERRDE